MDARTGSAGMVSSYYGSSARLTHPIATVTEWTKVIRSFSSPIDVFFDGGGGRMREKCGHPARSLSRAFARRGCSEKGFPEFGFKMLAGSFCVWAVQNTPPVELPNYRQFATLPTWLRSLRSLCHVEREKTSFSSPIDVLFDGGGGRMREKCGHPARILSRAHSHGGGVLKTVFPDLDSRHLQQSVS